MSGKRNILVVTPYPLLPAHSGGRLYTLSTIRPLASDYRYHLLAFANREESGEFRKNRKELTEEYHDIFESFHFEERPPMPCEMTSRIGVLSHLAVHALWGLPLMDVSYYRRQAVAAARSLIQKHNIDLLEVHHLHTAFFRRFIRDIPAVMVNHNIESELWPFWTHDGNGVAGRLWNFFGRKSRKNGHDIEILNKLGFGAKTFLSLVDKEKAEPGGCPLYLLPMSIAPDLSEKKFNKEKFVVLWIGGFSWTPNSEAALWFVNEIWPLVRKKFSGLIEVHFIGAGPPEELLGIQDGRTVFVHGYVKDTGKYLEEADAFIVPLKNGGGTRIKIVEAMNAGIPVVTTSKGCEGLPVKTGEDVLVADSPDDFAGAVVRLAGSIELRRVLSDNGRRYCADYHSPARVAEIKRKVYEACW